MKVENSYTEIWKISWPIMLGSLANTVVNLTDVAFVSRLGQDELAASALGGVFYFILVMAGTSIGIGSQILLSRRAGEADRQSVSRIFFQSLILLSMMGLILFVLLQVLMPSFMRLITHDSRVATLAIDYTLARSWGIIAMMILVAFRSLYTSISLTRIISYTTLTMMIANIILNYGLGFGKLGLPELGISGVGYASALSENLAAFYAFAYSLIMPKVKELGLYHHSWKERTEYRTIYSLSLPIFLQNMVSMGSWFLFFVLIEKLGTFELAVSNVVRGAYMVMMTPVWGFAQAANSMVSNLIGQERSAEVVPLVRRVCTLSLIFGLLVSVSCALFPDLLLRLISDDEAIRTSSLASYYIICLATTIFSVSMVLFFAVSGTGNTRMAMLIEFLNIFIYLVYVLLVTLVFPSPVETAWFSEVIYWSLMGVFCLVYLFRGNWASHKI